MNSSENNETSDLSQPAQLSELIQYQAKTIVSRTLVKKPTGTVTLFAFDQTEALSEHTAPFDALVQILDGRAAVTISGVEHEVKTGELILLPANKPHAVKALSPIKMLLTMIRS